jgi:16S rRNA (adenine1518-N6/adenine1519-N6)-dimethyltransferase
MKARLGQNFLVDVGAQRAIADALGDVSQQTVVEIGPGRAAITDLLAARARRVVAIELDDALAAGLRTRFVLSNAEVGEGRGVEVLHRDVLQVDLTELAGAFVSPDDSGARAKMAVVGNLPYYITSDILLHLFKHEAVLGRAVLMVQREVADRIVAVPGTREYGMLSATCQLYARVERLFTLPPEAFSPAPQVYSSVVRLTMAPRFDELGVEAVGFLGYLRVCFAQKRKTLGNNLRAAGYAAGAVERALGGGGVSSQARAETVTLEEQAQLFHALGRLAK